MVPSSLIVLSEKYKRIKGCLLKCSLRGTLTTVVKRSSTVVLKGACQWVMVMASSSSWGRPSVRYVGDVWQCLELRAREGYYCSLFIKNHNLREVSSSWSLSRMLCSPFKTTSNIAYMSASSRKTDQASCCSSTVSPCKCASCYTPGTSSSSTGPGSGRCPATAC